MNKTNEILKKLKRARLTENMNLQYTTPCRIVDINQYSVLVATSYIVTNFHKVSDNHSQFELWDNKGYIYTYEVNTMDVIDCLESTNSLN